MSTLKSIVPRGISFRREKCLPQEMYFPREICPPREKYVPREMRRPWNFVFFPSKMPTKYYFPVKNDFPVQIEFSVNYDSLFESATVNCISLSDSQNFFLLKVTEG